MRRKNYTSKLLTGILALLTMNIVNAITPFKVRDIQIQGLQRVDPTTILTYLPIKVGDTANDTIVNDSVKSLFSTGLFSKVDIESIEDVLQIKIVERPFVSSVTFSGNKEIDTDELKKIARESGLFEGRVFDKAVLLKLEQDIKSAYLARSKYGLKIKVVTSPIDRNRVNILFDLVEGEIAKIKLIKIIGLKQYTEKEIVAQMSSRTPGWMSWFTNSDKYAKEKLNADIEQIRSFYLSQGFFEFVIESSQVNLSPDKKDVFLTIVVNEGQRFKIQDITLKGGNLEQQKILNKLITIKKDSIFNGETFNEMLFKMQGAMGALGFANAQINPVSTIDYEKRSISFDIVLDSGARTYIRKINIIGNSKTRDSVVRREMRQVESSWYDADKIIQSRDRIDRLGFFKEVSIDTIPVEGKFDQIDLNIQVVEKQTGNISFGLGFNSTDKASLNAGISQDNIFGSGKNLNISLNTAKTSRSLYFSSTDPYFTQNGISKTTEIYSRLNKLQESGIDRVDIKTHGASVKMGVPVSEIDTVFFGLGAEYTDLKTYDNAAPRYINLESKIGSSAIYPLLTMAWGRDTRDSGLSPTKGSLSRAGIEAGLGSEISFLKTNYQYQKYYPINRNFTLAFNADIGYGKAINGKIYPFFKNYFVGGVGSVRGYEGNTLGSTDTNGDHIGGASKVVFNTEILVPLPGTGKDRSARLFTFVDGGYAWDEDKKINPKDLRWSGGIGLTWLSPIGPLKFSYGLPIKKQDTDKVQRFQFQIGTGF